ncbi:MAG: chemotaxis protein CheB [Pseudomonadota bacterium]
MKDENSPILQVTTPEKIWVGIGSSAGGLEALRELAKSLPRDTNATYIVVQHMAPKYKSMLAELIGRETHLAVSDITDGVEPQANQIYVTPPNNDVCVEGDTLRLRDPSSEPAAPKPSVDRFFRSLAEEKGAFSVGVVLSGTGSDGSFGVRAIREAGGITIAQDDSTAKYDGMPNAAVDTGCVDLVMPPAEIGAQFLKITKTPRDLDAIRDQLSPRDELADIFQILLARTRVDFREYKRPTVYRRVERRIAALTVGSLDRYIQILRENPDEAQALFKDLLISVTSFFRDEKEFKAIAHQIKKIAEDRKDGSVRVWITGCATGEEAYSIAILFVESLGGIDAIAPGRLQIFATDIDEAAIIRARKGTYPYMSLAEMPYELKERYFDADEDEYTIKKSIRDMIVFSVHNLCTDPPFQRIDLVSCRNLLIYFQSSLQERVFERLHYALQPNGVLFLGRSETISGAEGLFRQVGEERHIFRRRVVTGKAEKRESIDLKPYFPQFSQRAAQRNDTELNSARAMFDGLVEVLGKNSLLADTDLKLLRSYGNVDKFITIAPGTVRATVASLVKPEYVNEVRTLSMLALRRGEQRLGLVRHDTDDPTKRLQIRVYPIRAFDEEQFVLISFCEWTEDTISDEFLSQSGSKHNSEQVNALERELRMARESLQQTVEELETSNEELQAVNEELQSSNEELQSTNEELETSNEELQSSNEELTTVNEELHINSQELAALTHDLNSVLENVGTPVLVINKEMNIIRSSFEAKNFFGLSKRGEMPSVSQCILPLGFPVISSLIMEAIDSGVNIHRDYNAHGNSYSVIVSPYRSEKGELAGVVLVAHDTTRLTRAEEELRLIFDNAPVRIWYKDDKNTIVKLNSAAADSMSMAIEDVEGVNTAELFPEMADKYLKDDLSVIRTGRPLLGMVEEYKPKHGSHGWVRADKVPLKDTLLGENGLLIVAQDITTEKDALDRLKVSEERYHLAVEGSLVGLWDWDCQSDDLYWSPRFKEIIGITDSNFRPEFDEFASRLHPDDKDATLAKLNAHIQRREPFHVEYRLRRTDGAYVWIEARGQAIWDDQNKPIRMAGSVDDITERRSYALDLKRRSDQLALAAELARVGYWRLDARDQTVQWSDTVYTIHGVQPGSEEPTLQEAINYYHSNDRDRVSEMVNLGLETGEPFEFEARVIRPDGTVRSVQSKCALEFDRYGEVESINGVIIDITDYRERERELRNALDELARSNNELSRFAYVCSHDLKEPVRTILSMADIVLERRGEISDDERNHLLGRISANAQRLAKIIEGLLAYSQIDNSGIDLEEVSLNDVVSEVCEDLESSIKRVRAVLEVGALPVVTGARLHFRQIFQNLIGNSLKYGAVKGARVKVYATTLGHNTVLTVEDNGPGVPDGDRERIFSLFERLHRADQVDGAGLGLAICRKLIDAYHGEIWCERGELGGAAFRIKLPRPKRKKHV